MAENAITVEETPESKSTRAAIDRLVEMSPETAKKALRAIIGRQLRASIASWRKQEAPGGPVWAPLKAKYAAYKARVLGQAPVQIGIVTGDLRQSVASEINSAALEGRVGSSTVYAPYYAKYRRFLPTVEAATKQAQEIVEGYLANAIHEAGLVGQRWAGLSDVGAE